MKFVRWLPGVVVVLGAGLWFGGYLLPSAFHVTRTVRIAAPAEKVPLVAEPRRWKGMGRLEPA